MSTPKKISSLGILIILLSLNGYAQEKPATIYSIISEYESKQILLDEAIHKMNEFYTNGDIHKCATPAMMFAKHHHVSSERFDLGSIDVKNKASLATYVSASGKFEFTYFTVGSNAVPLADGNSNGVPDYVEWAGEAADSSYNHLVTNLGFTDPIPEGQVYPVSFLDFGFYGVTRTTGTSIGTRIEIENDFVGFPNNDDPDGNQRGALRVTMAHEFKHAIQFAQNNWAGNQEEDSDEWAEMDATLIEEMVYDAVNDYYNYLGGSGDPFGNPGLTVMPGSYEDITWALFFHERFGDSFWPETWDRIENSISIPGGAPALDMVEAVEQELVDRGTTLTKGLSELYAWHFAAGAFANNNFGFDEAANYPSPNVQQNMTQITDLFSGNLVVNRLAAYMINVVPPPSQTGDASVLVDTPSGDVNLAVVAIFDDGTAAYQDAITEDGLLVVAEEWNWADINRLGVIITNKNVDNNATFQVRVSDTFVTSNDPDNSLPSEVRLEQNYPNPFNPTTNIPVSVNSAQKVRIDIYDITGRLVQTAFDGTLRAGNYNIPVTMNQFSSGVYIYRLTTDAGILSKRMLLVK